MNKVFILKMCFGKNVYKVKVESIFDLHELEIGIFMATNLWAIHNVDYAVIETYLQELTNLGFISTYTVEPVDVAENTHKYPYMSSIYEESNIEAFVKDNFEVSEYKFGAENYFLAESHSSPDEYYCPVKYSRNDNIYGARYFKLKDSSTLTPHDIFTYFKDKSYDVIKQAFISVIIDALEGELNGTTKDI